LLIGAQSKQWDAEPDSRPRQSYGSWECGGFHVLPWPL
jgi:hypothetical protein